jgi:EAL domain-containing protein (putative c-di-GMP-specific phosphodiesterase class I)/ActR/RegA family two-component response regulator
MTKKSALKILLLDDEPFMLMLLGEILSNLGLTQVTACESGREALEYLELSDYSPDLVLLDINMPEMDGMEFVRHLAERHYSGSLILVSGEDERMLQTVEKLMQVHKITVLGHLQKPVKSDELSRLLEKWTPPWLNKTTSVQKIYTANEIRAAIANKELVNYYQPQVDVMSGRVVGVETLVRWQHPQDGIVLPEQFIHTAEAFGLIDDLTKVVVDAAFAQTGIWQNHTLNLRVSVNLSMDNLASLKFVDYLTTTAEAAGIVPSDIVLEITESQVMKHLSTSLEILSRLRLKRFGLSIDDFGTGYSSLAVLSNIPFSELKVDQGFVHGAAKNETLYAIYNASLVLAQQLGMNVVAEGVEDWEDWNLLRNTGCDVAQGYFIARPMPAAKVLDWVSNWVVICS